LNGPKRRNCCCRTIASEAEAQASILMPRPRL
jgi:hypothetical protein